MAEAQSDKSMKNRAAALPSETQNSLVRPSRFKYYIHDGIDACRLQLIGALTAADLPELEGCWRTVKTTLGKRRLILDLRELITIDEAANEWVSEMVTQGASSLPSSYSQMPVASKTLIEADTIDRALQNNTRTPGRLRKLLAILRTLRLSSPESSTQAP